MFENDKIIKEYEKLMENEKTTYGEVQKFINKNKPKNLYRYRNIKFIESETISGLIRICNPNEYNDPFDCGFYIDYKKYISYANDDVLRMLNLIGASSNFSAMLTGMKHLTNQIESSYKQANYITCFTEEYTNTLMWAHYADSHRGICIEYNYDKIPNEIRDLIFPVIYIGERYDASKILATHNENLARNPSFYKSDIWRYEKEWRFRIDNDKIVLLKNKITKTIDGAEYIFINLSDAIEAIYFGVNFDFSNPKISHSLNNLKSYAKMKNIKLYQMVALKEEKVGFKAEIIKDLCKNK